MFIPLTLPFDFSNCFLMLCSTGFQECWVQTFLMRHGAGFFQEAYDDAKLWNNNETNIYRSILMVDGFPQIEGSGKVRTIPIFQTCVW